MTALDDLGTWLDARDAAATQTGSDARLAQDQAAIDGARAALDASAVSLAGAQRTNAALTGQLTAMQTAYDAYRAAHPDSPAPAPAPAPAPTPTPPAPAPSPSPSPTAPKVVEFSDFATKDGAGRSTGFLAIGKSLDGAGATYRMTPGTSTHKGDIPTTHGQTNPLRLMRFGGSGAGSPGKDLSVGNFTLQATDQGHLYGGLQCFYAAALNLHDLSVLDIPGAGAGPPDETFAVELLNCADTTLTDVVLDAGGKSATMLGYNFTTGTTVATRVKATGAMFGFAVAMWRCKGVQRFVDCDFSGGRKAINIEQSDGGSYEFDQCDFRGLTGATWHAQVSSINGPCPVTFRDPVVDSWPLRVRTYPTATFASGPNQQKDSAIHCYIGGKDVTGDPSKFQIVHAG